MDERTCRECQTVFTPKRPTQEFCKPSCRWARNNRRRKEAYERQLAHAVEDPLWTSAEVARFLNITTKTLSNWRVDEIGPPFIRFNRNLVRYSKAAVTAWLKTRSDITEN